VKNGPAKRDFTIRADGKLLSETIALADVPEVARKTIQDKIGAGKLTRIDRNYGDDGKISFDVESKTGGKAFDFSVAADGIYLGEN